jgi:membrane protease YdiL (CAAX protease family)
MPPFFTPAFQAYVAPARRQPQIWRLLVGGLVIALAYGAPWLAMLAYARFGGDPRAAVMFGRMIAAIDPVPMLVVLATFVGMAAGPMIAARLVHGRSVGSLFGRTARVLRDFVIAALTVFAVYALLTLPFLPEVDANLAPGLWLRLLPLALAGVLLQTLAEELVFRGYILQGLAARFRSPLIWFVLPAVVFGFAHFDPRSAPLERWGVIAAVILVGLVAADLTRRTGALGAAWGLHFANNAIGLLVIATEGRMQGLALFRTPRAETDLLLAAQLGGAVVAIVVSWLLLVRLTAR